MVSVEVKDLSKIYRIYQAPTDRLKEIILRKPHHTTYEALHGVNFTVLQGETLGIVGENGAGKSTLLKVLARTLKPTSGSVTVNGRTAALLELGAGFNPELTGEENIYLNAYLMGLSKGEIDEKKEEIIHFSELNDFIKRPVKTYSSGMHMRLAFSIATCVNPDVLIVDEALAVGDEYFQKKCIDRMMAFRDAKRTILFCSHNLYYVQELCHRTVWLHKGQVRLIGESGKVLNEYQSYERDKTGLLKEKVRTIAVAEEAAPVKPVRIFAAKILNKYGIETEVLKTSDPVIFSFRIRCSGESVLGHLGFALVRNDEVMCFGTLTTFDGLSPVELTDGREFRIKIPALPLLAGMYSLVLVVADHFAMHMYDSYRSGNFVVETERREYGTAIIEHEWVLE